MDLWIRSQDREILVKVDKLEIEKNDIEDDDDYGSSMMYEYTDIERQYLLGIYKTKERALEVLDEIQNILKIGLQINNNNQFVGTTTYVYEMPKE